jgi:acyl carrier protein
LSETLRLVRQAAIEAFAHPDVPPDIREGDDVGDGGQLVRVVLNMVNSAAPPSFPGVAFDRYDMGLVKLAYDVEFFALPGPDEALDIGAIYDARQHSRASIDAMLERFHALLRQETDDGAAPRQAPRGDASASSRVRHRDSFSDPLVEHVRDMWTVALGRDHFGTEDDFFDLGGDSLSGLKVLRLVEERFGVRLSLNVLFTAGTLAEFSELVRKAANDTNAPNAE